MCSDDCAPLWLLQEHEGGNNVRQTEFKWEAGGENVLVSGSFNDWAEKIALVKK